jgi:hypothetical protein
MLMKSQTVLADDPSVSGRRRPRGQWLGQHFLLMIAAPLGLVPTIVWAVYYFTSGRAGK